MGFELVLPLLAAAVAMGALFESSDDETAAGSTPPSSGDADTPDSVSEVLGTNSDDQLTGSATDDLLSGLDGDDEILGASGNDTLLGNAGDDTLSGGSGDDLLRGANGADELSGDIGDDTLRGGDGADTLLAGDGHDEVNGGKGADLIRGGAGLDYLRGGLGNDSIDALDGDLAGQNGNYDVIEGGYGADQIAADAGDTVSGGEGTDSFLLRPGISQPIVLTDFDPATESLTISSGISNPDLPEDIMLTHRDSADGDALEIVLGDTVLVRLLGLSSSDEVLYNLEIPDDGGYNVSLANVIGRFEGSAGDDTINGSERGDEIVAHRGNDEVYANGGDDTISSSGSDTIHGGAGSDFFDLTLLEGERITLADFEPTEDRMVFRLDGSGQGESDEFRLEQRDSEDGEALEIVLDDNVLVRLEGLSSADEVMFDIEADNLIAPAYGGEGDDTLSSALSQRSTEIHGGGGDDSIFSPRSFVVDLHGDDGNDTIQAENPLSATIDGGSGDDYIQTTGTDGYDILTGGDGNDTLISSDARGTPNLSGGAGDDHLIYGTIHSELTVEPELSGGDGEDIFELSWLTEDAATITDFDPDEDRIIIGYTIYDFRVPPEIESYEITDDGGSGSYLVVNLSGSSSINAIHIRDVAPSALSDISVEIRTA